MGAKRLSPVRNSIISLLNAPFLCCTEIAKQLGCSEDYVEQVAKEIGKPGAKRLASQRAAKKQEEAKAARARQLERKRIRKLVDDHPEEYRAYHQAKHRCTNPNAPGYENWGGRGIQFRFTTFQEFYGYIGRKPSYERTPGGKPMYTLDRRNNDGHYEAGNVRWATYSQQARNQRHRKAGLPPIAKTKTLSEFPTVHAYVQAVYGTGKK